MGTRHSSSVAVAALVALAPLGLVACGGAPTNTESTESSAAAVSGLPIRGPIVPIVPPWETTPTGGYGGWVDGNGNPTTDVTITYLRSAGTVQHTGSLSYTVWDNADKTTPSENCMFDVTAAGTNLAGEVIAVEPQGPLLCNGTPYFGDMLPSYPYYLAGDLLANVFAAAAGDSVPGVCTATNGRGATFPTTLGFGADVGGENASQPYVLLGLVDRQQLTLNVTLVCE